MKSIESSWSSYLEIDGPFSSVNEDSMGEIVLPVQTTEQAKATLNFLLNLPVNYWPEDKFGHVTCGIKIMMLYSSGDAERRQFIEDAIVSEVKDLSNTPQEIPAKVLLRNASNLAQLSEELKLNERVRDNLWAIAENTQVTNEEEVNSKRYLYAWISVMQPKDGSWKDRWINMWNSEDSSYWDLALGALINVCPEEAYSRFPELLGRTEQINERNGKAVAILVKRLTSAGFIQEIK